MTEGARDPTFTRARGATDQQVLMAVDPAAGDETREDSPVEATRRAQIDVLDAGVLAQGGELETGDEALGVALRGLAIDEQSQALLE